MRQEHRHHTDEQIREAILFGVDVVDGFAIPEDLREKAFECAVNLRVAKSIEVVAPQAIGIPAMQIPRGS